MKFALHARLIIVCSLLFSGDLHKHLRASATFKSSGDDKIVAYSGREKFEPLAKDKPAHNAVMSGVMVQKEKMARYEIPFYAAAVRKGQFVADIGCGSGRYSFRLSAAVGNEGKVFCRDISTRRIDALKKKAETKSDGNLDIKVSKRDDIDIPSESLDVALLADVFQFVVRQKESDAFCKSLYKSMKPGGVVVVTYVTWFNLYKDEKWKSDYHKTLEALTKCGFEPGQRYVIEDKKGPIIADTHGPVVVLEFRKPKN